MGDGPTAEASIVVSGIGKEENMDGSPSDSSQLSFINRDEDSQQVTGLLFAKQTSA